MREDILNKKFNKKIHSGYDPEDVDVFFDGVISYLNELNAQANTLLGQYHKVCDENKRLNAIIMEKDNRIRLLEHNINQYNLEGYSNQRTHQEMQSLRSELNELKKEKK